LRVEPASHTIADSHGDHRRGSGHLTTHERCRVCGGVLESALDLGEQFLQGSFVKPGMPDPPLDRFPLHLMRCAAEAGCGLVQLRHTVAPDTLYSSYWYRSRINQTMRTHLGELAGHAVGVLGRRPHRVLDIGCNDGTLLSTFEDVERWGVEPSNAAADVTVGPHGPHIIRDYFPTSHPALRAGSFDVISTVAMFYDIDEPVSFARAVARLLAPGGVWMVEVGYVPDMMRNVGYDAVCHEHLTYYTLRSLERVLAEAGLRVVGAVRNDSNGGSICCFASRADGPPPSGELPAGAVDLAELRAAETPYGPDGRAAFTSFATQVREHRRDLRGLVDRLTAEGRRIHVYGASTKGNTLLQFCGLDHTTIPYAAERNPDKVGARTLGTDIPIISEADSRRMAPDYYLVLPWHFRAEIVERESATISAGTRFIFPLPRLEVVG
jgi:SAM-dependent methyltransferase